jgi:hypothetical protein
MPARVTLALSTAGSRQLSVTGRREQCVGTTSIQPETRNKFGKFQLMK